jgi:hypothetical protein
MKKELYTFQKEIIETLFTLVHRVGISFDEDILEIDFKLDEWKNAFISLDFLCLENTRPDRKGAYVDKEERIKIFKKNVYYIDTNIGYESLEFNCIEPSKTLKNKEILKILRGAKSRSLNLYIIKFEGKCFVNKDWKD